MIFYFPKKYIYLGIITILAICLLLAVFNGIAKGKALAQSRLTRNNAAALAKGLDFFYDDNKQFPTALEFSDPELMLRYFNIFPPTEFPSAACQESFDYKRATADSYQLNFCLPTPVDGYQAGWNTIKK